jgi:hypothetical protein
VLLIWVLIVGLHEEEGVRECFKSGTLAVCSMVGG